MGREIPDRWLNYKPIGKTIEGTRFIAFKVPLKQHISESVDDENVRLDTKTLLKAIPNLGLIIDLTNTYKYYNPLDSFENNGIQHVKIMVPGHSVPDINYRNKFKNAVEEFLKINEDNEKLIGVHCTHGVNRTGFLICNYMVNELNIKPEDAMQRFAIARGHPIERENYKEFISGNMTNSSNVNSELSNNDNSEFDYHSKRPRLEVPSNNFSWNNESWEQNSQNNSYSRSVNNSWREYSNPEQPSSYRAHCNQQRVHYEQPSWRIREIKHPLQIEPEEKPSWRERKEPPSYNERKQQSLRSERPEPHSWRELKAPPSHTERQQQPLRRERQEQRSWREREPLPSRTECSEIRNYSQELYKRKDQQFALNYSRQLVSREFNGNQESQSSSDYLPRSSNHQQNTYEKNHAQTNERFARRRDTSFDDSTVYTNTNTSLRDSSKPYNKSPNIYERNIRRTRTQHFNNDSKRDINSSNYQNINNNSKSHHRRKDPIQRNSMLDDLY